MRRGKGITEKSVYAVLLVTGLLVMGVLMYFLIGFQDKPIKNQVETVVALPTTEPTPIFTSSVQSQPLIAPEVYSAKIAVVGDLMVHEWQFRDAYNSKTDGYEFDYCFEEVKKYLQDADLTLGNLETTFAGKEAGYSFYPTFNAPDSFGQALKNAGFDLLTTANNHSNDKKEPGIVRTIDVLDELELDHVGTYKTQEARDEIIVKDINGIKIAFLSYSYGTNGIPLTKGKWFLVNLLDREQIKVDIKRARALNPDFVVVMPHMGNEYQQYPAQDFKDWAQFMFESGADVVLASHPHVLQPMEYVDIENPDGTVRRCFVIYSLGNFISSQRTKPRDEGIILNLNFEKVEGEKAFIKSVSYIPTWVKWKNKAGAYDIKVISVYDTLSAYNRGENVDLPKGSIDRLRQVHKEISKIYLNKDISAEEMQNEYIFMQQESSLS